MSSNINPTRALSSNWLDGGLRRSLLMRLQAIVQGMQPVLSIVGMIMLVVPIVDALYGGPVSQLFLYFGAVLFTTSFFLGRLLQAIEGSIEMNYWEALVTYSLVWVLAPALVAIPLSLELGISYVDALFECISGFTGTGLTILRGLDRVGKGVLFLRALMQWIGELGVVVFASLFFPFFWRFGYILYSLERPYHISISLRETAKRIFYIYFLVTVIGVVALIYLGVEPLDAVVHTMTAVATGGMSTHDANYEAVYRYAPLSVYPIVALMLIGGSNFVVLNYLLNGDVRRAWSIEEFRGYVYVVALFSILSLIVVLPEVGFRLDQALLLGLFNTISAMTTTGFNIGDVASLSYGAKSLLVISMFIGSMSFSTAGGIKTVRFIVLLKKLKAYVASYITGGEIVQDIRLGDRVIDDREVSNMIFFTSLHALAVFIGASLVKVVAPSVDFLDAVFEATSAASSVGLSVGVTSMELHVAGKVALMALMYFGRLEYTPLMILLGLTIYRRLIQLLKR